MVQTSAWSAHIADNPDFKAPDFPQGFPPKILVYGYFKRNGDWHPRQVDELTLEELEWIPIYEEAIFEAQEYIRKTSQFQSSKGTANG
jgi:hypothetical protein